MIKYLIVLFLILYPIKTEEKENSYYRELNKISEHIISNYNPKESKTVKEISVGAERAISSVRHFAFRSTKSKKISDLELYKILLSIAWHESNFKLKSFGLNGEIGPYQIKPATAVSIAKKYKIRYKSKDSLLDPRISSSIALYLILDYVYEHQRLDEAIKMYNQGPGYKIVHRENKAEEYLKDIKEKIHKLTI